VAAASCISNATLATSGMGMGMDDLLFQRTRSDWFEEGLV